MRNYKIFLSFLLILFLFGCNNTPTNDPVFTGETEVTIEVFSTPIDFTQEVTLSDVEDGDIVITESMIDNPVDFQEVGVYTVTYSFTDSDDNNISYNLTVNVVDTRSPVIALVGDDFITINIGEEYTDPLFLYNDNYYDDYTITLITGDIVVNDEVGIYHMIYSVKDGSGNESNKIEYTVYVIADVDYGYNLGDEVHMSGYYVDTPDGETLKVQIGFFRVMDIDISKEYPIGLSKLNSDEITIWTKDEYLINRNDYEATLVVDLDVPLLHQFDYSGDLTGSYLSISGYGCAITALTMVINYMNGTDFTPEETNVDLVRGGLVYWVNTNTEKYSNINPNYYPSYTQYRNEISFSNVEAYLLFQMQLKDKLDEGIPVLVKIKGNTTHYVVATGYGYDEYGKMYIKINDPGSSYRFYLSDLFASYQYFYEGFIYYTD